MDWCWYLGVKILGMSEEEFFKCTPRKLFALTDIHLKMNSSTQENNSDSNQKEEYIDNLNL